MTKYAHIVLSWLILYCYLCRPSFGNGDISTVKCLETERKALLQFKDGITGDSCGLLTSWRDDTDCCQWRGVHCSNDTGQVIKLRLQGPDSNHICLQGNLTSSLGDLKYLKHLNLNFNEFFQTNLDFLGSLANLEYLSLGYIDPRFSIKSHEQSLNWLSRLRLLRYLQLNGADLSHAEKWMQIVSQLPFLIVLRMDDCQLSAVNIPASLKHINSSSNLRVISLSGNNFNDRSIFHWLFSLSQISTRLEYLDLSFNSLEGYIPKGLGNLQHLSHLDLSDNNLKGPVLKGLGNLQHLSHLDLSWNHMKGPVLKGLGNLQHLSHLDLSNNQLEGPVLKSFKTNNFTNELTSVIQPLLSCGNTKLQILDLSHNHLWGEIPDTISSFSMLRELYLDGNHLNGSISQGIGQLAMLEKLYLSSNSLNATLTHTFFLNSSRLRELDLSDNTRIVMNIDASWDPPFQLKIIRLRSCKLGPYFPNWVKKQTKFLYLDVSNAEISDKIPISFWNSLSSHLLYLNMSYNQFYGVIPNLQKTVDFSVYEVDLSSNLFEGVIPSCFTNVSSLYLNNNRFSDSSYILCPQTTSPLSEIDLSNNLLSGLLPDCWMNFDQIGSLHLENNKPVPAFRTPNIRPCNESHLRSNSTMHI